MGDKKAVAVAQEVHLMLLARGGCLEPDIKYGWPMVERDTAEPQLHSGVIVDDFAVFEEKPLQELGRPGLYRFPF